MFEPLARFVIRPSKDKNGGDLILGKVFAKGLKPGVVYEIREFLDELIIREVGPTVIKDTVKDSKSTTCWFHACGQIVESGDHLYTEKEFDLVNKKRMEESNG